LTEGSYVANLRFFFRFFRCCQALIWSFKFDRQTKLLLGENTWKINKRNSEKLAPKSFPFLQDRFILHAKKNMSLEHDTL